MVSEELDKLIVELSGRKSRPYQLDAVKRLLKGLAFIRPENVNRSGHTKLAQWHPESGIRGISRSCAGCSSAQSKPRMSILSQSRMAELEEILG